MSNENKQTGESQDKLYGVFNSAAVDYATDNSETFFGPDGGSENTYTPLKDAFLAGCKFTQDRNSELLEALQNMMLIKNLIQYPDDTKEEHQGEAEAVNSFINQAEAAIKKATHP